MKLKKSVKYRMNVFMILFTAVLFYVLTPGILLSIPQNGSKHMKAAVHAVVFAFVYHFTHKAAWRFVSGM